MSIYVATRAMDGSVDPHGLTAKTDSRGCVDVAGHDIPMTHFLELVKYVLTNTDLERDDPRLAFIKGVRASTIEQGWNKNGKRIHLRRGKSR